MKNHKTPYKWAVGCAKMMSEILAPRLETDDLGSRKSQNALKTGGGPIEKKNKRRRFRRKKRKYILKS